MCKQLYLSKVTTVHALEKVLGTMESVRPSTPLAALHYRSLQRQLLKAEGDRVRLHIDNRAACSYIRRQGGTKSSILSTEACSLWQEAFKKNITILTPHWLSSKDNASPDFLSRNDLDQ